MSAISLAVSKVTDKGDGNGAFDSIELVTALALSWQKSGFVIRRTLVGEYGERAG
jgi:hypothetical protein